MNDAFSAAHRAHASTEGLAHLLPAYAGEQMRLELSALDKALGKPERPVLGSVGGSKVSTKLDLLSHLVTRLDKLAIGGGMANTFLYAQGHDVGASYCEKEMAETARDIIRLAGQNNCKLFLPLFDKGTMTAARHAAALVKAGKLVAVAGGGDTVAALNAAGVADDLSFVSTAGGAFLEWMEGKELPGVAALSK